jgi:hypothetical protein
MAEGRRARFSPSGDIENSAGSRCRPSPNGGNADSNRRHFHQAERATVSLVR